MQKRLITTPMAPAAIGPYTQGVVYKNTLYVSGQLGLDTNTLAFPETLDEEITNALYNLKSIVEASGSQMKRVIKVTVLLADMDDFSVMNSIYAKFFPENFPARECYAVKALPKNARIEISAIAYVREDT